MLLSRANLFSLLLTTLSTTDWLMKKRRERRKPKNREKNKTFHEQGKKKMRLKAGL